MFTAKILLVTGGTGSFGNAVVKKFLTTDIEEIRIFSRDEMKQEDMRISFDSKKLKFFIGDTRDKQSLYPAMEGVDIVFHAAALKQVPSCEFFPIQAIQTNVLGAQNIVEVAEDSKVSIVVGLSTDKAVYPINVMGMTKALMEKIFLSRGRMYASPTRFMVTRYGNVMGTRGSVIPLFIKQIKENKPITITDPGMTRFMMSLDDAMILVEEAITKDKDGVIYVRKAPACTLKNLARALQDIFKVKDNIIILGSRHGEKKHETLVTSEELSRAEETKEYFYINTDNRDLNYDRYTVTGNIQVTNVTYNSANTFELEPENLNHFLLKQSFIQEAL